MADFAGEIHLTRLWIPAGSYNLMVNAVDRQGRVIGQPNTDQLDFRSGEVRLLLRQYSE